MQRDITENLGSMLPVLDVMKTLSVNQELLSVLFVKQELFLIRITLNVVSRCIKISTTIHLAKCASISGKNLDPIIHLKIFS